MNYKLLSIVAAVGLVMGIVIYQLTTPEVSSPKTTSPLAQPEQYVILLDLSDRITKAGQIEADKKVILHSFVEFKAKVRSQACINSNDCFQVLIAPQRNLPFDKDVESQKLTLDLRTIKAIEKAKVLNDFHENLSVKLDSLYAAAYRGQDNKHYQGSNLWMFFNETLAELTSRKIVTRLVVLTDGYFDFEANNTIMNTNGLSTSTNFLAALRRAENWKDLINSDRLGLIPIQKVYPNLSVCVIGIRSKTESNLIEIDMLKSIWERWLLKSGISSNKIRTVNHGNLSTTASKLKEFLTANR